MTFFLANKIRTIDQHDRNYIFVQHLVHFLMSIELKIDTQLGI